MTSPGSASAGNLHANIIPDTSGFAADLRRQLGAITARHDVGVDPALDAGRFSTELRRQLGAVTIPNIKITVEPDVDPTRFNTELRRQLGSVPRVSHSVNIDPDVGTFHARLEAAIRALPPSSVNVTIDFPTATATGARIGRAAAAEFLRAFRAAMAAGGPTPVPGPGAGSSARAGATDGGAYARAFRGVVAQAGSSIPPFRVTLERLPEVRRDLNGLQRDLQQLAAKRIGIDISATEAVAEAKRIEAELKRLQRISPVDVNVEADIRAALAALGTLDATLARVGRDRTVRVNVQRGPLDALQTALIGSTSRMQLLITAALALGPAIVPAAAAATAAIGAIGGAAISAVAGLGVGVLALSGVVGAVKALNQARNDQAKTQATIARQDKQEATGADQVKSAIASLANTRAQAASQARQSARSIADAERGLADAQRDFLRVQLDINRAREEAADALEDLDSAIAGNATSIRAAKLEFVDAQAALAKVANLPVDSRTREEAEIAFERARQNLADLTVRQGRLAEEKARADKAGVEGSDQVVAAQQRINDAQHRVQEAEQSVADTRIQAAEQARQSAFSIAQAQQAVVSAQRSVATSAVTAGATAGTAMDTLREKLANLSPEGQKFAQFIVDLQPRLIDLRKSAEQALPGFQLGIQALVPALPALNDFIGRIAVSLGDMGEATGRALNSNRLRPFFSYIDDTAVPTLRQLGESVGHITVGIGNLIVGFGPVQRQLTTGLVDLTRRFEEWSATLDRNNGFQRFIDYAIKQGPIVLSTLSDIGGAIIHMLEGSAPIGEVTLRVLSGIAAAINAIPVEVITGLFIALTSLRIAALIAPAITALSTAFTGLTISAAGARAASAGLLTVLGGPMVIGIAAAVAAIGILISSTSKASNEFSGLQAGLESYRDAFKDGITPAATENARAILAQNKALGDFVKNAKAAGISGDEMVRALNGEASAREKIQKILDSQIDALNREKEEIPPAMRARRQAIDDQINGLQSQRRAFLDVSLAQARSAELSSVLTDSNDQLTTGIRKVREAFDGSKLSAEGYGAALKALGSIGGGTEAGLGVIAALTDRVAGSNLSAAEKADLFGLALDEIGASASTQGPQFDALSSVFTNIATSSLDATDKVTLLRDALDKLYGASISQTEASENLIRTKEALTVQLGDNSAGFDLNSAAGGANTQAILGNRDALQAAYLAAREKYVQDLANGVAEDVARAAHEKNIAAIEAGIPKSQRQTKAVEELNKTYGAIPDKKVTDITTPGLESAINKMVEAHAIQLGLSKSPPWTNDQISSQITFLKNMINGRAGTTAMFKADGGYIRGPGTTRSDSIPAWLSDREFVQPAHAVEHYGVDAMEAIRHKQIPRGLLRGYATGGIVKVPDEWPINISASGIKVPDISALRANLEAVRNAYQFRSDPGNVGPGPGFLPWPSSPGAQRGDTGVWKNILGLARSSGISFNFGNSYRAGDPLWHGSGRAIDFMGFNQDALANFFLSRQSQLLELIHLTGKSGYFVTRGKRYENFPVQGPLHRNHLHVAMADGGLVPNVAPSLAQTLQIPHLVRDEGGWIPPGLSIVDNRTGGNEWMYNDTQNDALVSAATRGATGDDDRLSVRVDNMYVTETGPDDIARSLFWEMKTR